MQQATTQNLYAYWNRLRNGRNAPRRYEVEPAKIANLLGETFIAEHGGLTSFRFRLAGTHICHFFGRELRGTDFLDLWTLEDRHAISAALNTLIDDSAAIHGSFIAISESDREAVFEFLLLPLIHTGSTINRILGSITAVNPPFWLGSEPMVALELRDIGVHWPDGTPEFVARNSAETALRAREGFRVIEGGLEHTNLR